MREGGTLKISDGSIYGVQGEDKWRPERNLDARCGRCHNFFFCQRCLTWGTAENIYRGVGFPFTRKVEGKERQRGLGQRGLFLLSRDGKRGSSEDKQSHENGKSHRKKKNIFFWLQYYYETEKSSFGTRFPPKDIFIYIFFLFSATVPTAMMHGT